MTNATTTNFTVPVDTSNKAVAAGGSAKAMRLKSGKYGVLMWRYTDTLKVTLDTEGGKTVPYVASTHQPATFDDGRRFVYRNGQIRVIKYTAKQQWANLGKQPPPKCGGPAELHCSFNVTKAKWAHYVTESTDESTATWKCNPCNASEVKCHTNHSDCCCHAAMTWDESQVLKADLNSWKDVHVFGMDPFSLDGK